MPVRLHGFVFFLYQHDWRNACRTCPFTFWAWINIAALTQVIFTILLVQLFSHRSFAAAVAFSKTEVLQTAIFEALILGVVVTVQTGFAIALGVFATVMLALVKTNLSLGNIRQSIMSRQMAIGLAAGAFSWILHRFLWRRDAGDDWRQPA